MFNGIILLFAFANEAQKRTVVFFLLLAFLTHDKYVTNAMCRRWDLTKDSSHSKVYLCSWNTKKSSLFGFLSTLGLFYLMVRVLLYVINYIIIFHIRRKLWNAIHWIAGLICSPRVCGIHKEFHWAIYWFEWCNWNIVCKDLIDRGEGDGRPLSRRGGECRPRGHVR